MSTSPQSTSGVSAVDHANRRRPALVVLGVPVGTPQIIAGVLLLCFAGQSLWLMSRLRLSDIELLNIAQGMRMWHGARGAADESRAPLPALLGAAPILRDQSPESAPSSQAAIIDYPPEWRWLARLPFLLVGVFLGASLWYVARRLCGNTGGYIALALYAFSPPVISGAASVTAPIVASWGSFGAVFTAIAVAHTLYAPREVVLWNWRRILLLGLSFGIASGAQIALVLIIVPAALFFLLYLSPQRRGAALAIFLAGVAVGALALWAVYGFHFAGLMESLRHAGLFRFSPELFTRAVTWSLLLLFFLRMPGVLVLLLSSLLVYACWGRTRFFGTTAPLLLFVALMAFGILLPHLGGFKFFLIALPFAFVFIAGVFADLLESGYRGLALGIVAGVLLAHAGFSISGLLRL